MKVNVKYVINRLWHEIVHVVPGISPRPISAHQLRCRAWYGSLGPILTDFVYLYTYEFWLSLWKIARSSVILLIPLLTVRKGVVDSGVCKMKVWSFKPYEASFITKISRNTTNMYKQYWPTHAMYNQHMFMKCTW